MATLERGQAQQLGRGLAQINLRIGRIMEMLEGGTPSGQPTTSADDAVCDSLFDLIDAVERTLSSHALAAPLPWWRRWGASTATPDLNGLRMVRDAVFEQLRAAGITPIPTQGEHDPRLHRIVEVREAPTPGQHGHICQTLRIGWQRSGAAIRPAHIISYRRTP